MRKFKVKLAVKTKELSPDGYQWVTVDDLIGVEACASGVRKFKKLAKGDRMEVSPQNLLKYGEKLSVDYLTKLMPPDAGQKVRELADAEWTKMNSALWVGINGATMVSACSVWGAARKAKTKMYEAFDFVMDRVEIHALFTVLFGKVPTEEMR